METPSTTKYYGDVTSIVVDEQNDFLPGGALAVADGDAVIRPTNNMTAWTHQIEGSVIFTRDWHPTETAHFDIWPAHCVAETEGAAFPAQLDIRPSDIVASKGQSMVDDGYSGLEATFEADGRVVSVEELIKQRSQAQQALGKRSLVLVMGLATDYCVKATVLDLLAATDRDWVDVVAVEDAMRAVNVATGDGTAAIDDMQRAGAQFAQSLEIIEGVQVASARGER